MARLPQPGGDQGEWGEILNNFLQQAHTNDGTLKPGSVGSSQVQDNSIPASKFTPSVQASLDNADAAVAGTAPDASTTTKGLVRLSGDLTGDALVPLIAPGKVTGGTGGGIALNTITNTNIHASAAIAKSKLAPLAISDSDISVGAAIAQSKIANLQPDLAAKASLTHTHSVSDITNLQTALDGKAATNHTHSAAAISDLKQNIADTIGNKLVPGSNISINYDAGSGETTISAAAGGGEAEPSDSVLTVAGRTGNVVLAAGDITSGTFSSSRIPNLDTDKITTGSFDIARIPTGTTSSTVALGNHTHSGYAATNHTHAAADITTGSFDIARIPTGTTSSTVALGNHTHSGYAATNHTHDDRYYTETEMDAALSTKLNTSEKGANSGLATLGSDGKIPASQLPALAIKETFTVSSQIAMLALSAQRGDMAIRTDNGRTYVLASDSPTVLNDWKEITAAGGGGAVTSVAGRTGAVTLTAADITDLLTTSNLPIEVEYTGSAWPARPNTSKSITWVSTKHINAPLPPTQPSSPTGMAIGDRLIRHPGATT